MALVSKLSRKLRLAALSRTRPEKLIALGERRALAAFRAEFNFPLEKNGRTPVYLCGNSLGLQPRRAVEFVEQELASWRDYAVDGHFHSARPWLTYHRHATAGFAELTGSLEHEVIAMNTLTVPKSPQTRRGSKAQNVVPAPAQRLPSRATTRP